MKIHGNEQGLVPHEVVPFAGQLQQIKVELIVIVIYVFMARILGA